VSGLFSAEELIGKINLTPFPRFRARLLSLQPAPRQALQFLKERQSSEWPASAGVLAHEFRGIRVDVAIDIAVPV
jgi:hypothetical protein